MVMRRTLCQRHVRHRSMAAVHKRFLSRDECGQLDLIRTMQGLGNDLCGERKEFRLNNRFLPLAGQYIFDEFAS